MRTLRRPSVLLVLTAILAPLGCSSTAGVRTGAAPKVRTIAAVGDKTLPAEAGEPGSSVAADDYTPERRVDPNGRVSGRVYDEKGDPVPNARVRLALGGTAGGKVVKTTTDRSGAFTLRGLRPGTKYTLVAESKDQDLGLLSGQAEAEAPESNVKITLFADDQTAPPARAAGRVNRVSKPRSDEADELIPDDDRPDAPSARGQTELLPPAPEAEMLLPTREPRTSRSTGPADSEPPMTARWRRGETDRPARTPTTREAAADANSADDQESYDDDGHDPLPPALMPGEGEPSPRTSANQRAAGTRVARNGGRGARVIVPENFTPITLADKPFRGAPEADHSGNSPAAATRPSASQPPPAVPWYETPADTPDEDETPRVAHQESALVAPEEPRSAQGPTRRTKWGDLAAASPPAQDGPHPAPGHAPPTSGVDGATALIASREAPGEPVDTQLAARSEDSSAIYCRFDAKSRRIVDFQLPDAAGKPTRFQDLDSDLVLIDFWGTWCKPCVSAIPHLVELQNRLGGKRLTVLGIASEQGPPATRAAAVTKAAKQFGINYPVLLSGMDGENCPLQEALHIQAFPTLILVDRQGHILWRDQGATPATLARLDHFIASATNPDAPRRY